MSFHCMYGNGRKECNICTNTKKRRFFALYVKNHFHVYHPEMPKGMKNLHIRRYAKDLNG